MMRIYMKRRGEREMGQSMTRGKGSTCKRKKKKKREKRETYPKLELIKQYRMGG